jgi:hypothetical protein
VFASLVPLIASNVQAIVPAQHVINHLICQMELVWKLVLMEHLPIREYVPLAMLPVHPVPVVKTHSVQHVPLISSNMVLNV